MYRKVRLLNVEVDDIGMDELVERFRDGVVLTLHVDSIMKLQSDREFYELLPKFNVITCDSQILTLAARLLGTPLKERVSAFRNRASAIEDPIAFVPPFGAWGAIA